ncbi:MAG: MATE family efflux transporter [Ruminococcus sp.]
MEVSRCYIFAPILVRLLAPDAQVIRLEVTVILRMVAVSEPFYGVPIVIEGMMQGVGKTVTPFIFNVAGMWGVRILGTFICIHLLGLGLVSAWGCMIGHNMLLFVLFTLHYFSGRWNPMNKTKVSFQYKTCVKVIQKSYKLDTAEYIGFILKNNE